LTTGRSLAEISRSGSSAGKLKGRFLPQTRIISAAMKQILARTGLIMLAFGASAAASAATLEGKWANPHRSVVVNVTRCGGDAYCGTVSWATARNRQRGTTPGIRVLSDLRPAGDGVYKGSAFEPKRGISGSATVRQVSPTVMVVKGCAVMGLFCKEQRWTRVS
jgi:uncharacterized protein (DUF2147 family)